MNAVVRRLRHFAIQIVPHGYLAVLIVIDGLMLLRPIAEKALRHTRGGWIHDWIALIDKVGLLALPQAVIATGLATMAIGIALRARVAWVLSLLLLAAAAFISVWGGYRSIPLFAFTLALAAALLYYWRHFNRTSLAAGTLFAILSIGSLMIYAVFGSLYLGDGFSPPIRNLLTAFYFSIVSMATVGYGDITPHSDTARLFTVSVIVLGITVFATSISAVIGPVIGGKLKHIVKGGISNVSRKNHYLIVGASPLAHNVYAGLRKRGYAVTVIVAPNAPHAYPENADLVIGDSSDTATLHTAGAETALAVLALRADDAENAFVILAIKDLAPKMRTVVLVNDSRNLQRLRLLQPDMVFSPQLLAGELLARTLNNETIDNDLIEHLLFGKAHASAASPMPPSAPI
ncbi:MAG: voltage-gated potassium channel protein [Paraburkholderia sp.]|uniref:voltage-gated potassium channel protein n=1 Tax=Paraburkholderia sp. TaxID=1926495 RepID=UPI0011FFDBB2|nr:voltage-gated potassium channel protein [Paraburkholderia sp.]TAM05151.1 MAG: voltage-gated potassium channel protein [Paraburkholderia sp.]TAM28866.1 MAG: voltage-gated potassium channel protein [Paraburkholderia sp.]